MQAPRNEDDRAVVAAWANSTTLRDKLAAHLAYIDQHPDDSINSPEDLPLVSDAHAGENGGEGPLAGGASPCAREARDSTQHGLQAGREVRLALAEGDLRGGARQLEA